MSESEKEFIRDRRDPGITKNDVKELFLDHSSQCPTASSLRELQVEVRSLWDKVRGIELLDHRITAVESVLSEIKASIKTTMDDIHKIQKEIEADNLLQKWAGRIIIAILSAAITFFTAKYT